jgi:hypothetical protein
LTKDVSGLRSQVATDISRLRSQVAADISGLRFEMPLKLADLPTTWGILGALITAYGAGLAAPAVLR